MSEIRAGIHVESGASVSEIHVDGDVYAGDKIEENVTFDVSGLPARAPRDVADIKLVHAPPNDGWLQHSRDGRYVYVGRSGDVIDTKSRKVVAYLPPLENTADFLEIDWSNGRPVATTNRYGVGYVRLR